MGMMVTRKIVVSIVRMVRLWVRGGVRIICVGVVRMGDDIPSPTIWAYTGDGRTLAISWVGENMNMEVFDGDTSDTLGIVEMTFTDWANWLEGKVL